MEFICENPRSIDTEINDCTVRATTLASGLDYLKVHDSFKKAGRVARRGCTLRTIEGAFKELKFTYEENKYYTNSTTKGCPTLARFCKEEGSKGNWVVIRRGHAFAVKDGVVYDGHKQGSRVRIITAFKLN